MTDRQKVFSLHRSGRIREAEELYRRLLLASPKDPVLLTGLGTLMLQAGNPIDAVKWLDRSVKASSDQEDAWFALGFGLAQLGRRDEALQSYERAIELKPGNPDAHYNRANLLRELDRLEDALAGYERTIALSPDHAVAYNNKGLTLHDLGRYDEALTSFDRAIEIRSDYAVAFNNRGLTLEKLDQRNAALASFEMATRLKPDYPNAHYNLGNALRDMERTDEALANFDLAIRLKPNYPDAHYNRGLIFQRRLLLKEALECFDRAVALKPDHVGALNSRGLMLQFLNRRDEALASFELAVAIKPDFAAAYGNRGLTLQSLKRQEEALASCEKAIELMPDYAGAHYILGNVLCELKRFDEALASYGHALSLAPDLPLLSGEYLHTRMRLCDWTDSEKDLAELEARIGQDMDAAVPFTVAVLSRSAALQRKLAEIWAKKLFTSTQPAKFEYSVHEKIRVGYFSADFHNHATAYLIAELFERHDRSKFELYAFSFGPESEDEMRERLTRAFDRFIDVRAMSDTDVARLSRELEIDIAVDLKGYTQDSRAGIFAERAAPIQASYLGYPGTMGAQFIDYLIADSTIIPEESRCHYSEKIAYLPDSYQVNDTKRPISEKPFTRMALGLPGEGFVFCCLNNNYKITPSTFDVWLRILEAVEGSVLWLYEDNTRASGNLRKEAHIRGISPERLVFAPPLPLPEHLARYRLADLFLDTFPCNAHTTASDALWAGLPVLTRMGETFASRVAASLLNAVHLPELVTTSRDDFEKLAIELARNPARLNDIRKKLEEAKSTAPLFDIERFTRRIEDAYLQMHERHRMGLPPDHLYARD